MKHILFSAVFFMILNSFAQENLSYQKPPKEILDLVDVQLAPYVLADQANEYLVLLSRDAYKSIEELSQEELRLGGLRIDPKTNIGSRSTYYNKIQIQKIKGNDTEAKEVEGMPGNLRATNFTWSPNQKKIAFTNTTSNGVEAWVMDMVSATAKKLTGATVNANLRDVINWSKDNESILVKMVANEKKPLINAKEAIPTGPTISVNDGKKAQNRTYQDLLKNVNDEHNFEQLALSEIHKISLDGQIEKWLGSAMYKSIEYSPNGEYVLVSTIEKPFSYLVPYRRFPSNTTVYTKDAKQVETVVEVPLIEDLPKGFMATRKGKRDFSWRNDKPASLICVTALDEGDPENEVAYRDEVFQLEAPFNGDSKSILSHCL